MSARCSFLSLPSTASKIEVGPSATSAQAPAICFRSGDRSRELDGAVTRPRQPACPPRVPGASGRGPTRRCVAYGQSRVGCRVVRVVWGANSEHQRKGPRAYRARGALLGAAMPLLASERSCTRRRSVLVPHGRGMETYSVLVTELAQDQLAQAWRGPSGVGDSHTPALSDLSAPARAGRWPGKEQWCCDDRCSSSAWWSARCRG